MATYTNSITLVEVEDGADGKAPIYDIELSDEKIYKSINSDDETVVISPELLTFQVFKTEENERTIFNDFTSDIFVRDESLREILTQYGYNYNNYVRKTVEEDEATVAFYIKDLLGINASELNEPELYDLQDQIRTDNIYFIIKIYDSVSNLMLTRAAVPIEFVDNFSLSITKSYMQAAVANGSMQYDIDGLTIYNGGFKIKKGSKEDPASAVTLFEYDEEAQSLQIVGSGTFTGTVNATDGSFTGTVNATNGSFTGVISADSGKIGNFIITSDGLQSANGGVVLSGTNDGSIYAKNIQLGENATVEGSLKAGKIGNTDDYYTELTKDGQILLGGSTGIVLDGETSTITTQNNSFRITPDFAEFNNIIAKGRISAATFEINKVQTVGGNMIFKPSYKIDYVLTDLPNVYYYLSDELEPNELKDHYIYFVDDNGRLVNDLCQIDSNTTEYIVLKNNLTLEGTPFSIIDLGAFNDVPEIMIGINSNQTVGNFLYGRGLTISEMNIVNGVATFDLKAFLGDLTSPNVGKGYGLYSSNVYLTGSLITQISTDSDVKYAGVNTLDGVMADGSLTEGDSSEIIFWAGSKGNSEKDIKAAPFQVTKNGSIYAQQGKFEGAIISNSVIEGTRLVGPDIYTAMIHGIGTDEACLRIYDSDKAIGFFDEDYTEFIGSFEANTVYYEKDKKYDYFFKTGDTTRDSKKTYYTKTEQETFSIKSTGLCYFTDDFIKLTTEIQDNTPIYIKKAYFNDYYTNGLHIGEKKIDYISTNVDTRFLDFNKSSSVQLGFNSESYIGINSQRISLENSTVYVKNNFNINDKLQYKPKVSDNNIIGYDLYVY